MSYNINRASILLVRDGCEACYQVVQLIKEPLADGKIVIYNVFQSRKQGMWEIRAEGAEIEGLPTLFSSDQIKEVPMLYDPVLDDIVTGLEDIEEYLEETGLLNE